MFYSIYEFIDMERELEIRFRINTIAPQIDDFMVQHEFILNIGPQSEDGIGLDFSYEKRSTGIKGNIGFEYIDKLHIKGDEEFKFYVLKAIDVNEQRLYKRLYLPKQNIKISELESNSLFYLEICINLFNKWGLGDLHEKISLKYK